jgi:hypothetical protein
MDQDKVTDELVTVAGGVEIEVSYQQNGTKEMVKVRQIPISQLQKFLLVMGDEAQSIELYCDKPKGWSDTLTIESANAIADKGQELNTPFLRAWWRRQARWRNIQAPWTGQDVVKKEPITSRSGNSVPQSPITTT